MTRPNTPRRLYWWQQRILRYVLRNPGASTREIGARYYPGHCQRVQSDVARHELLVLLRENLVQMHRGRWSPALMAGEMLRRAGVRV
jgi:hypothetical protein